MQNNNKLKANYRTEETSLVRDLIDYIKDSHLLIPSIEHESEKIAKKNQRKKC